MSVQDDLKYAVMGVELSLLKEQIAEKDAENARLQAESDARQQQRDEFMTENARLRAALEAYPEWFADNSYGEPEDCFICHNYRKDGHRPDCLRQAALGLTEVEK
jgi:FtsZ-binding cell division protein ZapB